ncbi:MAG: hypothetical protein ISS47_03105 [Candidatus Omnitrophica bacterium]|nr:hypothetical protein [Candidatus Omnitrophota bacterium]
MTTPLHLGKYRVFGNKEYIDIYKQLKGKTFNEYHSLFTLCVFLGYKKGKCICKKRKMMELFWSNTFSQYEYGAFYTLVMDKSKNKDYSLLKNGQKTLELLQNYADGGMELFLKSDVIKKHVKKRGNTIILDFSPRDHLQKQIMYYVFKEAQT